MNRGLGARRVAAALLLAAAAAVAPPARANGRFPSVASVVAPPDAPDVLLVGGTYGLVLTTDAAQTWSWVCEEALGFTGTYDPILLRPTSGALLAATSDGIVRSTDGGCTWLPIPGIGGRVFLSLLEHPAVPGLVYATSAAAQPPDADGLFVSTDGGATFAPSTLVNVGELYSSVAVTPADPMRVYVTSFITSPLRGWIHRSDDGGATWTIAEEPLSASSYPTLLGVSTTDPDVVLWIVDGADDVVWRSDDGGATGVPVLTIGDYLSDALVAAGGTMYVATRGAGLWRSDDDGLTWTVGIGGAPALGCLAEGAGGVLYGCTTTVTTGFAVMSSADEGLSFGGVYALDDVSGPLDCPAGTPVADLCAPLWPAIRDELATASGGADAGVGADGGTGGGGGCRCDVVGRP